MQIPISFFPELSMKNIYPTKSKTPYFKNFIKHAKILTVHKGMRKKSCFQNALVVRAFIDAGIALGERSYIEKSKDLLMWMDLTFLLPNGRVSSLLYPNETRSTFAFLEDYALWAEAMLAFATICEVWELGNRRTG